MHLKGVTCTNCHDPHTATLKLDGNAVCTQCHNPSGRAEFLTLEAKNYDTVDHHFHSGDSAAAQCVSCHMTSRTYMGIDARRDHSFRVPRPDLSDLLDVPDACTSCHDRQTASWAAEVLEERFGPREPHYGEALAMARQGVLSAEPLLADLAVDPDVPVMVRAAAVAELAAFSRGYTLDTLRSAIKGEPLLRMAATEGAESVSPQSRWRLLSPLLEDDLLAIRTAAFRALIPLAADPQYRRQLAPYLDPYLATLALNLDFPEAQSNVAAAHLAMGDLPRAEAALEEALVLQPTWVPALLNLADLYRATRRDPAGEALLRKAMLAAPESPAPVFSYALWLTRQERAADALSYFREASRLDPQGHQYGYAYALALNGDGQSEAAVDRLELLLELFPDSEDALFALVTILRDQRQFADSLQYVDRLVELRPADDELRRLREALRAASG
jgi:predicted CXXCH cytochrome family protein